MRRVHPAAQHKITDEQQMNQLPSANEFRMKIPLKDALVICFTSFLLDRDSRPSFPLYFLFRRRRHRRHRSRPRESHLLVICSRSQTSIVDSHFIRVYRITHCVCANLFAFVSR